MPELPEVESLRRGLEKRIIGQKIRRIEVRKPKLVSGKGNVRAASAAKKARFTRGLTGQRFTAVERRAKNLIFRFASGKILLVHLKMSGQFVYKERGRAKVMGGHPIKISESELPNKHTHVIFELSRGTLFYNDTRMFGYLLYYPDQASFEKENHFAALGVEPLSPAFTADYLYKALHAKKGALKPVLMNQGIVAGLGNIYADEAAFAAGIRPGRKANTLTRAEVLKLHAAIKKILPRAIRLGGSSVISYRLLDESRGNYAREHKVYNRAGEECLICALPLKKITVGGRTTVYCQRCQR